MLESIMIAMICIGVIVAGFILDHRMRKRKPRLHKAEISIELGLWNMFDDAATFIQCDTKNIRHVGAVIIFDDFGVPTFSGGGEGLKALGLHAVILRGGIRVSRNMTSTFTATAFSKMERNRGFLVAVRELNQ